MVRGTGLPWGKLPVEYLYTVHHSTQVVYTFREEEGHQIIISSWILFSYRQEKNPSFSVATLKYSTTGAIDTFAIKLFSSCRVWQTTRRKWVLVTLLCTASIDHPVRRSKRLLASCVSFKRSVHYLSVKEQMARLDNVLVMIEMVGEDSSRKGCALFLRSECTEKSN